MGKVNDKLQKVYEFTVDFINKNGYSPSIREICEKCDIKSTSSAFSYVERLKNDGLLVKSPLKKRALSTKERAEFISIPVIGSVRAGEPIFATENLEGYIPLPTEFDHSGKSFALRVQGDSMINAGIFNVDQIFVQCCNTANNGDMVVAIIEDGATVKTFYKENGHIRLQPENADMDPIIVDDCQIVGKVFGCYRFWR